MALLLERNHTKHEILEAYLNEVYMGQRGSIAIHGVGEAANHYFGKPPNELSLPEAALLAGLIKGPNAYSPYRNPDAARKRRDLVLEVLHEQGKIDRDAYESALVAELGVRDVLVDEYIAPYYVEELREELSERYGDDILQTDGMSIYSTLDAELQRAADDAVTTRARAAREGLPEAAPQERADPGGGGRARSADGRDPRARRRARLPAQPVQPRVAGAPPAGQRVQADRAADRARPARAVSPRSRSPRSSRTSRCTTSSRTACGSR